MRRRAGGRALRAEQPRAAEPLEPYRRLAVRVIAQAWRDLLGAEAHSLECETARTFLCGSPALTLWCELAQMDAMAVHSRARSCAARRDIASLRTH